MVVSLKTQMIPMRKKQKLPRSMPLRAPVRRGPRKARGKFSERVSANDWTELRVVNQIKELIKSSGVVVTPDGLELLSWYFAKKVQDCSVAASDLVQLEKKKTICARSIFVALSLNISNPDHSKQALETAKRFLCGDSDSGNL